MGSPDLSKVKDYDVVLGTSSKYRHALFKEHFPDIAYRSLSPDIDEKAVTAGYTDRALSDPAALTLAVAHAKATALEGQLGPRSLLVTSDQVISHAGRVREKPRSAEECREYLRSYAAGPAVAVTAVVVVLAGAGERRVEGVDVATQHFRALPERVIDALVAKGDVLHCAGGFAAEDELMRPYLARRDGDLDSVMGLPVRLVRRLLAEATA